MHLSSLLPSVLALASTATAHTSPKHISFTVVKDVFVQSQDSTSPTDFDFIGTNFGLINRTYSYDSESPNGPKSPKDDKETQWQRLARYIKALNKEAPKNERYVLLFMARHGEGFHNAAESYFGTPAWNCYWAPRDGNSTVTWADAKLTEVGIQQALKVKDFWNHLIKDEKITPPEVYYSSPMDRCLDTARLTWEGVKLPPKSKFKPIVKELLREGISAHTCNRRSTKSYIKKNYPEFKFEKGFPEEDPYWTEFEAEPSENQDARSKVVLDDIFTSDDSTYVSISSHSGEISSLLRVLGHRSFRLATGSAIPVLVKVTTLPGAGVPSKTSPYEDYKVCSTPPSIRDSSCNDCSCCT